MGKHVINLRRRLVMLLIAAVMVCSCVMAQSGNIMHIKDKVSNNGKVGNMWSMDYGTAAHSCYDKILMSADNGFETDILPIQDRVNQVAGEMKLNTEVDHQVELIYFFPDLLESSDIILIWNQIWITPPYQQSDFNKHLSYTLGFFRDGELVETGVNWRPQGISYYMNCQYFSREYLSWHPDLADGDYELRLLYRIDGETPEDEMWVMPSQREGEAAVFMTLKDGHATFRQANRHPCDLKVSGLHTSVAREVGMQNTFTVDIERTSEMRSDGVSDVFCYVDGEYVGREDLEMGDKTSTSYTVDDFGYIYYFTPEHTGPYNVKIIDGRNNLLYEEDIEVAEAKDYQLRVNHAEFIHSTVPNTINEGIDVVLEIENIGQYRYKGDVICRPVIDPDNEEYFLAPRFQLDIAPGEVVRQKLPMDFKFYLSSSDFVIIKCYYTSNGESTVLWQSERLDYIDPETNDYSAINPVRLTPTGNRLVYNVQGVAVTKEEQAHQLPPGVYIIEGKKVIIK